MEKNPLVSVIIPYYNSQSVLKRAADSLAGQSYRRLEIILVNDGSGDGSREIAEELARNDDRIVNIDVPHGGVSAARNAGLEKASGFCVMFADSDDWMNTGIIEQMVNTMYQTDADLVTCRLERAESFVNPPLKHIGEYTTYSREEYLRILFRINTNTQVHFPVGKLYRKDLLPETLYPRDIRVGEDVIGTYLAALHASKIVCLEDVGYYYYINPKGVTTNFSEKDFDLIRVWDRMTELTAGKEPDHTYALFNRYRTNFTLLFRMITEVNARDIRTKYSDREKQLLADLRSCEKELMRSPFVLSRKVLIWSLCHLYPLSAFGGNCIVKLHELAGTKPGFRRRKL